MVKGPFRRPRRDALSPAPCGGQGLQAGNVPAIAGHVKGDDARVGGAVDTKRHGNRCLAAWRRSCAGRAHTHIQRPFAGRGRLNKERLWGPKPQWRRSEKRGSMAGTGKTRGAEVLRRTKTRWRLSRQAFTIGAIASADELCFSKPLLRFKWLETRGPLAEHPVAEVLLTQPPRALFATPSAP